MRVVWPCLALVAGCYRPDVPAGVPCSSTHECAGDEICGADGLCGGKTGNRDAGDDAGSQSLRVHARVGELQIVGDQVTEAIDGAVQVRLDDGSRPSLAFDTNGSVTFARASADQRYAVITHYASVGSSGDFEVQSDASDLTFLLPVYAPSSALITLPTSIDVNVLHGELSGGTSALFASGQRASLVSPGSDPFAFTADWSTARAPNGVAAKVIQRTRGDDLWLLHYATSASGVSTLDGVVDDATVEQSDGEILKLRGSVANPSASGCASVSAPVGTEIARVTAISGPSARATGFLGVLSQPSASRASDGAVVLGFAPVSTDTSADILYGSPFAEDLLAGYDVSSPEMHSVNGTVFATAIALQVRDRLMQSDACGATVAIAAKATIPIRVAIDGAPLTSDDQSIVLGEGPVDVTLSVSGDAADLYRIALVDVTTATTVSFVSATPAFHLDHARLPAGHRFLFTLVAARGYPAAAFGDMTTLAYPVAAGQRASTTFQVVLPP